jgi:ABC-type nitrate/sulfonate/bicarbonate transport system substrate-binding protein
MRDQGYDIQEVELAESELATEGVAQGRFQFAEGTNNSAFLAVDQGSSVLLVVDRNLNEWMVYAREGIETCDELVASRVAVHSPGSVSGAMLRDWISKECSESAAASYDPLIIAGSQNRYAAMLADQIDASPVELPDALRLDAEGGFNRLASFREDLPDLHPQSVYVNGSFLQDNPDVVRAFIRELLLLHREINSQDGRLFELYKQYLPEEVAQDEALAREITDAFVEAGLFPDDGGLTPDAVKYTVEFFGPDGTGDLSQNLPVESVSDLSHLEAVLNDIGRE